MARKSQRNRLRKQPKARRMHSATAVKMPRVEVPKTAQKRRRRMKTAPVRFGFGALKRLIWNARWVSLGLFALTVWALMLIWQSERFYLTYIPVEGTVALAPEEVVGISDLAGHHIFAADPSAAAAKITALPGVISSTVTLNWPNQVMIRIAEESPVALWQDGGFEYWITESGALVPARKTNSNLLEIVAEMSPIVDTTAAEAAEAVEEGGEAVSPTAVAEAPLPEVTILDEDGEVVETAPPPEPVAETPPASVNFVPQEVLQGALQLQQLRPNIDRLYYRPGGGLSYQDGRGWRVYFGAGTNMHQRLVVYEKILEYLQVRGITPAYVSVSNMEKPFYMAQ